MNQSIAKRYDDAQMGAAQLVASALGRSLGVKVLVANVSTAMTDGETIWLPPLPVEASEQLSTLLWGFIHHEAGHLRHTDFSLGDHIASENDELLNSLRNILEDIRMESEHMRLYPGAHRVLCDLLHVLKEIGFYKPSTSETSPSSLVCNFLNKYCRTYILRQPPLEDHALLARKHLEDQLGPGFVTRLVALAHQVTACTSSEDSLNLAYRIREFLEDEQSQAEEQQQAEQSDAAADSPDSSEPGEVSEQNDPSDAGNSNSGPSSSENDRSSDGSDPAVSGENGAEKPEEAPPSGASAGASDESSDNQATSDFLKSVLSGSGLDSETGDLGDALSQVLSDELDGSEEARFVLPTTVKSGNIGRDDSAIAVAQQVSAKLALQLKRLLESEKRIPTVPKAYGQRVSRRHLHRVAFKDYRVFNRPTIQESMNTSIVCLLDTSSSMGWSRPNRLRIHVAREALLATTMALSSIRESDSIVRAESGQVIVIGGPGVKVSTEGARKLVITLDYRQALGGCE